jgi:hypothetical protein
MEITFSVDERTVELARTAAAAMGKSLNEAVRDYLDQLATGDQVAEELRAFTESATQTPGRLAGQSWDRDEANRRV